MLARIRRFLRTTPYMKTGEHLLLAFASAFALTAIATLEHAAGTHGFQLSWSFLAAVASTAATGGYQAIRPGLRAERSLGEQP
jgi:hypothetical protein